MTNEGSNKIVNFMTPGIGVPVLGHGHIGCIVKMHHFFENLILYSWPSCRGTSSKTVNFIISGAGFLC